MDMDFKVSKGLLVKMVLSKLAPLASMVMKNGPKKTEGIMIPSIKERERIYIPFP